MLCASERAQERGASGEDRGSPSWLRVRTCLSGTPGFSAPRLVPSPTGVLSPSLLNPADGNLLFVRLLPAQQTRTSLLSASPIPGGPVVNSSPLPAPAQRVLSAGGAPSALLTLCDQGNEAGEGIQLQKQKRAQPDRCDKVACIPDAFEQGPRGQGSGPGELSGKQPILSKRAEETCVWGGGCPEPVGTGLGGGLQLSAQKPRAPRSTLWRPHALLVWSPSLQWRVPRARGASSCVPPAPGCPTPSRTSVSHCELELHPELLLHLMACWGESDTTRLARRHGM